MEDKRIIEQSAWNLSEQIIMQIGNLLQSASRNFRTGSPMKAYWDFEEIRILIYPDLAPEERDKLRAYEIDISKCYAKSKGGINEQGSYEKTKEMKLNEIRHYEMVKEYRMYIMQLLAKYGYSIKKEKDKSRMF